MLAMNNTGNGGAIPAVILSGNFTVNMPSFPICSEVLGFTGPTTIPIEITAVKDGHITGATNNTAPAAV
jgi:hypothetical protein